MFARVNFIPSWRTSDSLIVCGAICRSTVSPRSLASLYCGTASGEKVWSRRPNQPRLRTGVAVGKTAGANMLPATKNIRMCKTDRRFMSGLKQTRKLSRLQKRGQTLYPIGMKTLCALACCLAFAATQGVAKQRHCTFRVHAQANARDTEVFATSVRAQVSGKNVAIEKMPWISERDVVAFAAYPTANGTYGALFQLDDHGRVVLDTLS